MNTQTHIHIRGRMLVAVALLLTLSFGTVTPGRAQPLVADEALNLETIATLERSLNNPSVRAKLTEAQWHSYGERMAEALASGNEGLRQGALRMIILYGPNLGMKRAAVFEVVRIYRNHKDDRLRRMAVVALGNVQDSWAMDMLKRSVRFEKEPRVQQTIRAVLAQHSPVELGPAKVGI